MLYYKLNKKRNEKKIALKFSFYHFDKFSDFLVR